MSQCCVSCNISAVIRSGGSREVPGFPWNPPFSKKKLTTSSHNGSAAEAVTLYAATETLQASYIADSDEMYWACPVLWDFPYGLIHDCGILFTRSNKLKRKHSHEVPKVRQRV